MKKDTRKDKKVGRQERDTEEKIVIKRRKNGMRKKKLDWERYQIYNEGKRQTLRKGNLAEEWKKSWSRGWRREQWKAVAPETPIKEYTIKEETKINLA